MTIRLKRCLAEEHFIFGASFKSILKTERNQNFSSKPLVGATATSTKHPVTAGRPMTLPRPPSPHNIRRVNTDDAPDHGRGNRIRVILSTTIIKADCRRPYATH